MGKYSIFALAITEQKVLQNIAFLESCLRGRKDMFAKHAYWKRYQGFESLTLRNRQKNFGA